MKKSDAIQIFGSQVQLAKALGITKQAIWHWPDELDQKRIDRIRGAAIRMGIDKMQKLQDFLAANKKNEAA